MQPAESAATGYEGNLLPMLITFTVNGDITFIKINHNVFFDLLCVLVLVPAMQEYCQWETFNASCSGSNEIVLITAARYGRMRVGRCLPVDYYVGCFADVLDHVEIRCSGRSSCIISVPDAELFRVQPCRKDLVAYFEAAYRCVPGKPLQMTS